MSSSKTQLFNGGAEGEKGEFGKEDEVEGGPVKCFAIRKIHNGEVAYSSVHRASFS